MVPCLIKQRRSFAYWQRIIFKTVHFGNGLSTFYGTGKRYLRGPPGYLQYNCTRTGRQGGIALVSYSEDTGFKARLGHRLSSPTVSAVFLSPFRQLLEG
jgi:hypothetical protein